MHAHYSRFETHPHRNRRRVDAEPTVRLLVPVDLSAPMAEQLECAKRFAQRFDAMVEVLHVVQLNIVGEESGVPRSGLIQELMAEAREELQKLIAIFWEAELVTTIVLREGRPDQVILQEAHAIKACLLIMGARHRAGIARLLRRHTLARVIRHAPCPVVAVRIADGSVEQPPESVKTKKYRNGRASWQRQFSTRDA